MGLCLRVGPELDRQGQYPENSQADQDRDPGTGSGGQGRQGPEREGQ